MVGEAKVSDSVFDLPGFSRDFDCFDSENEWDGKVVSGIRGILIV